MALDQSSLSTNLHSIDRSIEVLPLIFWISAVDTQIHPSLPILSCCSGPIVFSHQLFQKLTGYSPSSSLAPLSSKLPFLWTTFKCNPTTLLLPFLMYKPTLYTSCLPVVELLAL